MEEMGGWRKGPWTPEEDKLLAEYVSFHGEGRWTSVARSSGLNRNGKSCRLRWVNYLRPGLKRSHLTPQEQGIITELHALWGNKWSTIARYLPGRTDNEIKNYWRTHLKKNGKSTSRKQGRRYPQRLEQQEIELKSQKNDTINYDLPNPKLVDGENLKEEIYQGNQETSITYPIMDDVVPWPNTVLQGDFDSWGGMWNLDMSCAHAKIDGEVKKIVMQDQVNTYSSNKFIWKVVDKTIHRTHK